MEKKKKTEKKTQIREKYVKSRNLLAQRAGQNWFQLGDNSNKYFQIVATIKRRKNQTWRIKDDTGMWHRKHQENVETIIKNF